MFALSEARLVDELTKLLRDVVFPAAVAIFVLWRLDRTLHEILVALLGLGEKIDRLRDLVSRRPAD